MTRLFTAVGFLVVVGCLAALAVGFGLYFYHEWRDRTAQRRADRRAIDQLIREPHYEPLIRARTARKGARKS